MPQLTTSRSKHSARTLYVAVIGDVVESRTLSPSARTSLQEDLQDFLVTLNEGYKNLIVSEFVITTGDEFQGLLNHASIVPDLVWATDTRLGGARIRYGIGYGELHTPLQPMAIGMDGPVFHKAREAITRARKQGWRGGVFRGFGKSEDRILNGLARLLERHFERMTVKQRQVADLIRDGFEQSEIAEQLNVTRQAVSDHIRSMGWEAFNEGEEALRFALRYFSRYPDSPTQGRQCARALSQA